MNFLSNLIGKLPSLAVILTALRSVLEWSIAEIKALAEKAPDASLKADLLAAAAKLQDVLDSTELANVALQAVEEVKQAVLTGKAPSVHHPTDLQ